MPELDFGDNDDEALTVLKGFAHRVNNDLYNHGRDGLLSQFKIFVTKQNTKEEVQEKRHNANTARLNIIIALLAAIAAYIAIVISIGHYSKSAVDPLKFFHTEKTEPALYVLDSPHQSFVDSESHPLKGQ